MRVAAERIALKLRATRAQGAVMLNDSPCPPGHNTTVSFRTSAPVSFKRLLGRRKSESKWLRTYVCRRIHADELHDARLFSGERTNQKVRDHLLACLQWCTEARRARRSTDRRDHGERGKRVAVELRGFACGGPRMSRASMRRRRGGRSVPWSLAA